MINPTIRDPINKTMINPTIRDPVDKTLINLTIRDAVNKTVINLTLRDPVDKTMINPTNHDKPYYKRHVDKARLRSECLAGRQRLSGYRSSPWGRFM